MTKIAFIGAGSRGFTRELVRDILTFPLLCDATLVLMDIDGFRSNTGWTSMWVTPGVRAGSSAPCGQSR